MMKMLKIAALLMLVLSVGCAYLGPTKAMMRNYEKIAAAEVVDSAHHLLCNAPLSTVMSQYTDDELLNWMEMCGYELEGYKIVSKKE